MKRIDPFDVLDKVFRDEPIPEYKSAVVVHPAEPGSLLGVPIYVPGEGIIGQLLRITFYERDGARYANIDYGIYVVYAVIGERLAVPFMVYGFMVPDAPRIRSRMWKAYEYAEKAGEILNVPVDRILNMDEIMRGEENGPLIVDVNNILPLKGDDEVRKELAEARKMLGFLQRQMARLERQYRTMETRALVSEAQVRELRGLVLDLRDRLEQARSVVYSLDEEARSLRAQIRSMLTRVDTATITRDQMENLLHSMLSIMDSISSVLSRTAEEISAVTKPGGEEVSATPTPAGGGERGESERR